MEVNDGRLSGRNALDLISAQGFLRRFAANGSPGSFKIRCPLLFLCCQHPWYLGPLVQ